MLLAAVACGIEEAEPGRWGGCRTEYPRGPEAPQEGLVELVLRRAGDGEPEPNSSWNPGWGW